MNPGPSAVWVGLFASISAILLYIASHRLPDQSRKLIWLARVCYLIAVVSVLTAFTSLVWIITHHEFQYKYVWEHSARDLSPFYLFASTWSGQEGSFLLWAVWTSLIGILLIWKAGTYENRVMPIFISVIGFLCAILAKQTPFSLFTAHELFRGGLPPGVIAPPDGAGLNPSLQNYWMAIHPPTIFFGFSSLAVPFSYAIAAMIWKDWDEWVPRVLPYALLSCATLGAGLFMGGYWAYETQGWHGFWAWDPVENASFFPWLAITALIHGFISQRTRRTMVPTNLFLSFFAFWLWLLGTFLTRSGALAAKDSKGQLLSVHAFDDIGKSALIILEAMLIVYGLGSLILWISRWRSMPKRSQSENSFYSRDSALVLAMLTLVTACVIICIGTIRPLIDSWLHHTPNAVLPIFYNTAVSPEVALVAFLMGVVPWLSYRRTNPERFVQKVALPWFGALAIGLLILIGVINRVTGPTGTPGWLVLALTTLGAFAILSNIILALRLLLKRPILAGGWISHVGLGMIIVGAILTNVYERSQPILLKEGRPSTAFGYTFNFVKMTRPSAQFDPKNAIDIQVTPPSNPNSDTVPASFNVYPRWFINPHGSSDDDTMRWPAIKRFWDHDLYVGLAEILGDNGKPVEAQFQVSRLNIKSGQTLPLGPYAVTYVSHQSVGGMGKPGTAFWIHLLLKTPQGQVVPLDPGIQIGRNLTLHYLNTNVPQLDGKVLLESLNGTPGPDFATAHIAFNLPGLPPPGWEVALEITNKPYINLVWFGVLTAVFGILLSLVRRVKELRMGRLEQSTMSDASGEYEPVSKLEDGKTPKNGHNGNGHNGHRAANGHHAESSPDTSRQRRPKTRV